MTLLSTDSASVGVIATFALACTMELSFSFLSFLASFAFLATFALLVFATSLSTTTVGKRDPAALLAFTFLSFFALALANLVHVVNLDGRRSIGVGVKGVLDKLEVSVS